MNYILAPRYITVQLGEILIAVGTYGKGKITNAHNYTMYGVDCTMQYAGLPETNILPKGHYPYTEITQYVKSIRDLRKFDALNWVPYIMSGWDASPWGGENRSTFDFPTRKQWNTELNAIKCDLLAFPGLGFPKKDGSIQKAFTIFAWNEFGEGGYVAPTVGDQYMKLEEIEKVFGSE